MNLSGKELTIEVDPGSTAKELKAAILDSWGFPVIFQKFLIETEVIDDAVVIATLVEGLPEGEPLRVLCIYSKPYDGDINKAAAAGDREAIRALMQERDKGREQLAVPALITLILNRRFETMKGWPRTFEALIERGYTQGEVDAAIAILPERYSYQDVLQHLQLNTR
eukprot:CAMPEP_0169268100 /NCGR_PEP_ID=MMETSP1016-20121227/47584_1 /TAXON_ID=342587 /ORGANISM="Karlodinium micrum, Strain CCMP2283" /LENGTH=166 /DNA_ID=CAMNT_0009352717 /DNA_START=1 /DNA_END=497 /DNA_ORIENTATION=-